MLGQSPCHGPNMLRCGAAASPDDGSPGLGKRGRVAEKVIGGGEVDVAAVNDRGIPGIGHHAQRGGHVPRESRKDLMCFLRAQRAVHADRVCTGNRECRKRVRRFLSEGRPSLSEECHLCDDRNLCGERADRAHGLGRFEETAEGLQEQQIDPGVQEDACLLFEDLTHLDQREASVRLDQGAERPDRSRDKNHFARGRLPGQAHPLPVDLLERVRPFVGRQLHPVGVPGVCRQDARSGVDIVPMNLRDRLGIGEIERGLGLLRSGPARVEQGSDRAVGQQKLFGQGLAKILLHEAVNSRGRSRRCQIRGDGTKDVGNRGYANACVQPPTSSSESLIPLIHSSASSPGRAFAAGPPKKGG